MFCSHISLILASLQPPRHCVCGQDLCRSPGTGPWDYTGSHPYLHCSNLHSLLTVPAAANIDLKSTPALNISLVFAKCPGSLFLHLRPFTLDPKLSFWLPFTSLTPLCHHHLSSSATFCWASAPLATLSQTGPGCALGIPTTRMAFQQGPPCIPAP